MIVFRLCKSKYCHDLSGSGAEKSGGRWNSKGIAMLYTSNSRALCTTEIAAHAPLGILPSDYFLITIVVPDLISILEVNTSKLPPNWKDFPPSKSTQKIGDKFISENNYLVMKVPSVIVQGEYNYLFHPHHKSFNQITILKVEAFEFNKRLFER